jgi:hypothetical protein
VESQVKTQLKVPQRWDESQVIRLKVSWRQEQQVKTIGEESQVRTTVEGTQNKVQREEKPHVSIAWRLNNCHMKTPVEAFLTKVVEFQVFVEVQLEEQPVVERIAHFQVKTKRQVG